MRLIAGWMEAAAALSGKFHVVVTQKKNPFIYFILHFEEFLPLGITESLREAEKVSYSHVSKQFTTESKKE